LWMADSENEFDLSKLRYEKLCTISELWKIYLKKLIFLV
jgi:hypothetical protein